MSTNWQEALERVSSDVVAKHAADVDTQGRFPEESVEALAKAGLLGAVSEKEVGGLALGPRGASEIVRRLSQECGSTGMVTCMHYCGTAVIEAFGDITTRKAAATGEHFSTLAFSEAGSRSHFWIPVSTATKNDTGVVLDAKKSWVTSASKATAYVWSSRPLAAEGLSTIWLVPSTAKGMRIQGPFNGLGLRGNDSSPASAEGVHVPMSAMLGEDGKGFDVMMGVVLPLFNVLNASCSIGLMEGAVARTAKHAGTKYDYSGSALNELPTIRNYIARMQIKTDMAKMLLNDTLSAMESGREDTMLRVLECKAAAGETATEVLDLAMRVCGGAAFRKDVGVERYFRDTRASGIMAPTTDVLYDFIGKAVTGLPVF
ncbi:MAG: acyl-CoA/acyl-ACP dehydrogenase [Calditrichaeota bacterium]|nr:acyl-CoA/acyl-ACP dehydrogenase [Calditrichota bacterium]